MNEHLLALLALTSAAVDVLALLAEGYKPTKKSPALQIIGYVTSTLILAALIWAASSS